MITSIDDYSRKILFADFFPTESTWAHIHASQSLILTYGLPLRYYVNCLREFGFVQGEDIFWRKHVLQTDEIDTQWHKMMRLLNVDVSYALSPQAKGKVERPYRWLQDRIAGTCIYEDISQIGDVRIVLRVEIDRHNNYQVHSTTGEIPGIRFEKALETGISLFRIFSIPKPYTSLMDVFCLREQRSVNGYYRVSLFNHVIEIPNVSNYEYVDIHLVLDDIKEIMNIRIWWNRKMAHSAVLPLNGFPVYF